MTYYGKIPDLFDRFPDDHEDPRLAGKLEVGAWSDPLFQAIDKWIPLQLIDAPWLCMIIQGEEVYATKADGWSPSEELTRVMEPRITDIREHLPAPWGNLQAEVYCQHIRNELLVGDIRIGDSWTSYTELKAMTARLGLKMLPEINLYERSTPYILGRVIRGNTIVARTESLTDRETGYPLRWKLRKVDLPAVLTRSDVSGIMSSLSSKIEMATASNSSSQHWHEGLPDELKTLNSAFSELKAALWADRTSKYVLGQFLPVSRQVESALARVRRLYKPLEQYAQTISELAEQLHDYIDCSCDGIEIPSAKTIAPLVVRSLAEFAPAALRIMLGMMGTKYYPPHHSKITDFVQVSSEELEAKQSE